MRPRDRQGLLRPEEDCARSFSGLHLLHHRRNISEDGYLAGYRRGVELRESLRAELLDEKSGGGLKGGELPTSDVGGRLSLGTRPFLLSELSVKAYANKKKE